MLSSNQSLPCGHNQRCCYLGLSRDLSWMRYLRRSICVLVCVHVCIRICVWLIRIFRGLYFILAYSLYYEDKYLLPNLQLELFWCYYILGIILATLRSVFNWCSSILELEPDNFVCIILPYLG